MTAPNDFRDRIAAMCRALHDLYVEEFKRLGYTHDTTTNFTAEYGQKNVRIVSSDPSRRSVYCFVEISTGDILKADGWKKPAKGKRGSIWNENCDVGADKPCNLFGGGLYIIR